MIPDSVRSIGYYAFSACDSLLTVILGSGLVELEESAFNSCPSLSSIVIPDSVTTIGDRAFAGCTGLTNVSIGRGVANMRIGEQAFESCTSLATITIPAGVISIGAAFADCTSLTEIMVDSSNDHYASQEGVLFNKDLTTLVTFPAGRSGAYVVPDGVTAISYSAFAGSKFLTNLTLAETLATVDDGAFNGCTGLTAVQIPAAVTSIGWNPFGYCTSLTNLQVDGANAFYKSIDGVLFNKTATELIAFPAGLAGSYAVPHGVSSISSYAFEGSEFLTGVTIPETVIEIGEGAFALCESLSSIAIPDSVKSLGRYALQRCAGLRNVTIGNGVPILTSFLFEWCTELRTIVIGSAVVTLEPLAFNGCSSLSSVLFRGNAPALAEELFDPSAPSTIYYLPGASGWLDKFDGQPTQVFQPVATATSLDPSVGFDFSWMGTGEIPMTIQRKTSLHEPWVSIATNIMSGSFSDPAPPPQKAFYRAVLP